MQRFGLRVMQVEFYRIIEAFQGELPTRGGRAEMIGLHGGVGRKDSR